MDYYEEAQAGYLYENYSNYILDNHQGDRAISNGSDLILAMEAGYLLDEFIEYYLAGGL